MSYTESDLPDVLSRSSEMVEEAAVEEEGGGSQRAEARSHVNHHLFVYIEAADHLRAKGQHTGMSQPACTM